MNAPAAGASAPSQWISVRGARTHNLKNISLEIPKNQLVVITGLSGSGKSSLAFDTIYAEGQRRYVESLSAYARQFLQTMDKPDVDSIQGLSPAIAIEQKAASHNPRSTVGTVTEIHDYLRLLYARAGTPFCPEHDLPLAAQSPGQMADTLLALPGASKLLLLAPVIVNAKGEHAEWFAAMQAQGFVRFRVDGKVFEAEDLPRLKKTERHDIAVVVDRFTPESVQRQRLIESLEVALRLADGKACALEMQGQEEHWFNARLSCPRCHYALPELEPRLFSFNSPQGACPHCSGLGEVVSFDPLRVVAFPDLSLQQGAIPGWDQRNPYVFSLVESLAKHYGFSVSVPFNDLPRSARQVVLYGSGDTEVEFTYRAEDAQGRARLSKRRHAFEGVIPNWERRLRETDSEAVRESLRAYQSARACEQCEGTRLRREARSVRLLPEGEARGQAIFEASRWPLFQARTYFESLKLPGAKAEIAAKILLEISSRLRFLDDVGLGYLTLERAAATLSGGEAQRIRLASQIGSGLTGVVYVLDEPSIGLHQRDNTRLIATLQRLRDLGNSVLVVEHDEETIRAADHVIDIGPGAGVHGGQVTAEGHAEQIAANADSLTGRYLSGAQKIAVPERPLAAPQHWLRILGARGNNLKGVNAEIPVGRFTVVTGVSGSGKSTLINDTLYLAAAWRLHGGLPAGSSDPAAHERIEGLEHFDKVIDVDQSPIGRTPRSNPATYTGLFTLIRDLFTQSNTARERGYDSGRFSFNVKGGRCEACQGDGLIKIEMHFLPDVYVLCESCQGKRYNRETLEVSFKGRNIAEVLDMTVEEAAEFFSAQPPLARKLQTLVDVGLGYIKLGQSATTLSGGEAQRVKLALELSKRDTGRTLYILDEPTTGLHFADVALLLKVLHQLRDAGNTVVVIEHHLDVIKTADWLVDLGPEGGGGGGQIVAQGSPEQIAQCAGSHTGKFLKPLLARK